MACKEFEHLLKKQSYILEVGCGEGQNVLYLAKQGYCNIDAFDISESGISKLRKLCEMNHLDHMIAWNIRQQSY